MIKPPAFTGYGVPEPMANVHYCSPDNSHRLHHTIGMGRVPGWYVMTVSGCLGDIEGPFESESAAQALADAWSTKSQADRKARGL